MSHDRLNDLGRDPRLNGNQNESTRSCLQVLDQLLWPPLFHATKETEAARGLFGVAGVYRFAGDEALALAACEDLIQLYPETDFTPRAIALLEQIKSQTEPNTQEKENP